MRNRRPLAFRPRPFVVCAITVLIAGLTIGGCATNWVTVRKVPRNPLAGPLRLLSRSGPKPTQRTEQFLRRNDLSNILKSDPREMLTELQKRVAAEPTAEGMYAISELAYIEGVKAQDGGDEGLALDMFGASVAHAYMYLLDERFDNVRNPYDPQYRRTCDVYNLALEGALRIVTNRGDLRPGFKHTIDTGTSTFDVEIVAQGRWKTEEFDRILFANDYEVNGLTNHYHTYGLGVPLIAVRKSGATDAATEDFYPPNVTFPITAFLRVSDHNEGGQAGNRQMVKHCVLELFDPRMETDIVAERRRVPLESDMSVPLAYFLNQPAFSDWKSNIANLAFLDPNAGQEIQGLYMLEPFDPNKIPVILVHGLASSPVTWTEMYNDLRSEPEIGKNYQFWFYFYPTGQPFWVSATQFRVDLAEALKTLDPDRRAPQLDQMVLVGHSMGGLVSKLQTIESGHDYWQLISDGSPEELEGSEEAKAALLGTLYFKPSPSIRRVVTIGTPHRGSYFANPATRWAVRMVAELPNRLVSTKRQLVRNNPGLFKDTGLLYIDTGVDSLTPDSPFLPAMIRSPKADWVHYHNIVGIVDDKDWLRRISGAEGDGVVELTSARVDGVDSEVLVPADHVSVHRHPRAVREVQRVLREHLQEMQNEGQHWLASYGGRPPRLRGPRQGYRLHDHFPSVPYGYDNVLRTGFNEPGAPPHRARSMERDGRGEAIESRDAHGSRPHQPFDRFAPPDLTPLEKYPARD